MSTTEKDIQAEETQTQALNKPHLHKWQKEFTIKPNLLQKDFEAFEQVLYAFDTRLLGNSGSGCSLKAAISAGWIEKPDCETGVFDGEKRYFYAGKNVDELHPGAVRWLGIQIDNYYNNKTIVPKAL
jgi:hypothetical protein